METEEEEAVMIEETEIEEDLHLPEETETTTDLQEEIEVETEAAEMTEEIETEMIEEAVTEAAEEEILALKSQIEEERAAAEATKRGTEMEALRERRETRVPRSAPPTPLTPPKE